MRNVANKEFINLLELKCKLLLSQTDKCQNVSILVFLLHIKYIYHDKHSSVQRNCHF